jgi:predicted RNase H-like HicB family nuclease
MEADKKGTKMSITIDPANVRVRKCAGGVYRCQVYLCPMTEGGFEATAATLEGVVASGATEREALDNINHALADAIKRALADGGKPVWTEVSSPPSSEAQIRWLIVHTEDRP